MDELTGGLDESARATADPKIVFHGHWLRIRFREFVDHLDCLTCGITDWHRWTPFTGGTWVGPSPAFDFYAGEHHRPEVLLQSFVVREVVAHVGAPPEHVAAYELLAGLTSDKLTSTNLFQFLAGDHT